MWEDVTEQTSNSCFMQAGFKGGEKHCLDEELKVDAIAASHVSEEPQAAEPALAAVAVSVQVTTHDCGCSNKCLLLSGFEPTCLLDDEDS